MRRKFYLAAILAAVMVLQAPLMVFAEDEVITEPSEPEVHGDITITDAGWKPAPGEEEWIDYQVAAWGQDRVITTGNVTSTVSSDKKFDENDENSGDHIPAVSAGDGGTVNVNGNVSSQNTSAIYAENGTVKVTGDVTSGVEESSVVIANEGSTVEIGGNVANVGNGTVTDEYGTYGTSYGIEVLEQSTVKVGGDVTTKSGVGINVNAEDNSKGTVEVGGSVSTSGEPAIITNAASNITVGGDVTGKTGIIIRLNGDGGTVEVLGAVKSTTEYASVIAIETDKNDKDDVVNALPTIVVGSLEGAKESPEDFLYVGGEGNDVDEEVFEAVYQQILYYIAQDKFANATLSVEGANEYKNGYTSNEGNSLTVTIATADGYEVSSVSGADVVRNADGTYTVVVQRGKGIDINAVISAVVKAQQEASGSNTSGSGSVTTVIVVPAYTAAQKQFQTQIAAQLKTLPAGDTLTLDMKDWISFNKKTFEVLAQRKDIDMQIIYTWKGKRYAVVIPAGYDILSLLNADGYCGCLYLNSIFGSTELVK